MAREEFKDTKSMPQDVSESLDGATSDKTYPVIQNQHKFLNYLYRTSYYTGVQTKRTAKRFSRHTIKHTKELGMGIRKKTEFLFGALKKVTQVIFHTLTHPLVKFYHGLRIIVSKTKACYQKKGFGSAIQTFFKVICNGCYNNRKTFFTFINHAAPIAAVFGLIMTIGYFYNLTFGLVVEYDGVKIGYIANETVFNQAEKMMQGRIIYEEDQKVIDTLPKYTLSVVDADQFLTVDAVTDKLIEASGNAISPASGLYIDNDFMGATADAAALQNTLDSILAKYKTGDKTEQVSFIKDVEIKSGLYPVSSIVDAGIIDKKINQEVSAQKVYTVQKNDAPILVAQKNDVSLSDLYELNPEIKTKFLIGQEILIARSEPFLGVQVTKTEVYKETTAYKTVTTTSKKYSSSYKKVTQKGKDGITEITASVTYVNGVATEKDILSTKVIQKAVDERVTVGGAYMQSSASIKASTGSGKTSGLNFIWPVSGRVSCGWYGYYNHRGLDIAAPKGTAIRAAADGVVVTSTVIRGGYGRHIIVDHGNGVQTMYAHNSVNYVKVGQKVKQGELIGGVGRTGWATGNHVHFAVIINGSYRNPANYLS